eukprot:GHVT01049678.1.p1 GENE.GHVT01049678.1~~GHVT01049678.1.p1  ORF type:complete len:159 (+),score=30.17 GHVT01049678.1:366-842(+)
MSKYPAVPYAPLASAAEADEGRRGPEGAQAAANRQRSPYAGEDMADGGSSDSGESDDGELPQRAQESRQRRRRRRRWRRWLAWAWLKLNGVLWIGTSVILIERSNLFSVIWTCSALHSGPLWAGASSLAASLALLFFLAVVQPLRGYEPKKLAEDQPW